MSQAYNTGLASPPSFSPSRQPTVPHAISPDACFALLDDSSAETRRSRLYTGLVRTLACYTARSLPALLDDMQHELAAGRFAVGLFEYELGARMHGVLPDDAAASPLAQILLFSSCQLLDATETDQWLRAHDDGAPAGVAGIRASVDAQAFSDAISRIHAWIEAGDTYQINYTFRLHFDAYGTPLALYRRLRARQPVPYGALIALPDGKAVLSLSPELFVRHDGGVLTARPMKGTAPACGDANEDARRAAALAADPKNRAENLMIVDLLRNDLGRVAEFGSVRVPQLFQVERFASVLQMTSTVEARLQQGTTLAQIFAALYPCGSITGAPKRRTMQIINALESEPRGIYTGAIGWFEAPEDGLATGDFCLSVPIRTLVLDAPAQGVRRGRLGVGAGIVHDSVAADEYEECRLKARFLTGLPASFALIETILVQARRCRHLDLHLARLRESAAYFGFAFDALRIRDAIDAACAELPADGAFRARLCVEHDGACEVQTGALAPLDVPVKLVLANEKVDSSDLFLRHKTTQRSRYDAAWREAERQGAFDMLFFNERGELTEGARSNVFVRLGGRWYTPPLSAGVLPGVMRSVLLADPAWNASERTLTRADLGQAEEIIVCNALRGALPGTLV